MHSWSPKVDNTTKFYKENLEKKIKKKFILCTKWYHLLTSSYPIFMLSGYVLDTHLLILNINFHLILTGLSVHFDQKYSHRVSMLRKKKTFVLISWQVWKHHGWPNLFVLELSKQFEMYQYTPKEKLIVY